MPWKQAKHSVFHFPTRQELQIIATSLVICLAVITYFVLRT
ncbi:MAG TPA: hypothetical protein VFC84_20235 [Desulfosporosinus sp.]|nr:hypothetical protein [Desulfosporosinus sp.]